MKTDHLTTLDILSIDELDAILARAQELRDDLWRKKQAKAKEDADAIIEAAMQQARATLASVGLPFKESAKTKPRKPATGFEPKADHIYQHPDNPSLKANGTGVKPKWWGEVIQSGKQPVDLGPVTKAAA